MHVPYRAFKLGHPEIIDTFVKLNVVKIFPFLNPYLPEFSDPPIPKMYDPVLVTLIKMQHHPAAHPN